MLPFAVGVAISPIPIIAMVLMLGTTRARLNGPVYLLASMASVAGLGTVLLVVAGSSNRSNGHAHWVDWTELVLGVAVVALAVRQWRRRPRGEEEPPMPAWMGKLDDVGPLAAAGLAVLLSIVNPKNLLLIVGGAAAVAGAGVSAGDQAVSWAVFTVVAAIGIATPLAVYLLLGDRAPATLARMKTWMARNNTVIVVVLLLVIGAKLIGDGIGGLS
jgi:hypothetical protein